MEYKIKKYTFFESYPSILKHKIPIISMLIGTTYIFVLIFYWLKAIKYVIKFHEFKKTIKIDGATSEINYPLTVTSINTATDKQIIDVKKITRKTFITFYKKGSESVNRVKELLNDGTIEPLLKEYLPKNKNFYLREEVLTIFEEDYSGDVILLTKGYNIAAMRTLNIFSFLINKKGEINEYKISLRSK